jgi:hypothetical protein
MEKVDASPTKEFFINMLTRDVPLDRAILDLVDNSVDAAYQAGGIQGKKVSIRFDKDHFFIEDNCGGISKDTAKQYAFKFGRSKDDQRETPHSVGQFGVGMKRTLFKIGQKFMVESNHPASAFRINVDVNEWLAQKDRWAFYLEDIEQGAQYGTKITVGNLLDGVSEQFELPLFLDEIIKDIEKAHFKAISEGLEVIINGRKVEPFEFTIKYSEELNPVHYKGNFNGVNYSITAGVDVRDLHKGGWYIVCNGRLIEEANTDSKTGWGVHGIRNYHPDFAFFRGIVEFDADDSSKLPWTTTKTSVDTDNFVYRKVQAEMKKVMVEVIAFLNKRRKEDDEFDKELIEEKPLNNALERAPSIPFNQVAVNERFLAPDTAKRVANPDPLVNVQYKVNKNKMDKVKDAIGLQSNREVGEYSFEYVFDYEVGDE